MKRLVRINPFYTVLCMMLFLLSTGRLAVGQQQLTIAEQESSPNREDSMFYKIRLTQHISVDFNNTPMEKALREIAGKTHMILNYRGDYMTDKLVNFSSKSISVSGALDRILKNTGLDYLVSRHGYLVIIKRKAPVALKTKIREVQFEVSGKVTDAATGESLPGVNVLIKGTENGTATDSKGNYSLSASGPTDTLVFSYIGYETKVVPVNGRHEINVSLSVRVVQGQQMVVVGYGEQKRVDITGSITTVSSDQIEKVPVTDVAKALEGKVAGLTVTQGNAIPGTSPSIQIRGQNSISASNDPLIVVDGMPFSGGLNDINQNDIANVSVLKGPSATAIYGTRGSNGVIIVTTKKGQKGKARISYSGYVGTGGFSHELTPASPSAYIEKYKWYQLEQGVPQDQLAPVPNSPGGNEYVNYKAGKTVNWMDEVTQPGYSTDNNLTISGGTNTVNYYISGEFMKQRGVVRGYNFSRANVRVNLDATLTDYLEVGTNAFYDANNYDGGQADLLMAEEMSPYGTLYNSN